MAKAKFYCATFENGAEYRFYATSLRTAEKVAENRALELETKVKELTEKAEADVAKQECETECTTHDLPVIESKDAHSTIEATEEGCLFKSISYFRKEDEKIAKRVKECLHDAKCKTEMFDALDEDGEEIVVIKTTKMLGMTISPVHVYNMANAIHRIGKSYMVICKNPIENAMVLKMRAMAIFTLLKNGNADDD